MFDTCVLGVDPGIASLGLAAVCRRARRPHLLWSQTLRTSSDQPEELRLREIYEGVTEAIARHGAASVAVERVAWNRNVTSGLHVARATGVVLLAAADAGLRVEEYGPLEVKSAVTGVGNADKAAGARRRSSGAHGLRDVPVQPDAADAVAVAAVPSHAGAAASRGRPRGGCGDLVPGGRRSPRRRPSRVVLDDHGVGYDLPVPTSTVREAPGGRARAQGPHADGRARRRHHAVRVLLARRARALRCSHRRDRRRTRRSRSRSCRRCRPTRCGARSSRATSPR